MIPFIRRYLLENWSKLELGERPEDILFIKFPARLIRSPEVELISFLVKVQHSGQEQPLLILRLPRYPASSGANESLEIEYRNLLELHLRSPVIPRPIARQTLNSCQFSLIGFLEGRPLSGGMLTGDIWKNYIEKFGLAFSWLVGFQKAFDSPKSLPIAEVATQVSEKYQRLFNKEPPNLAKIRERADKLGGSVPIFPQHGDYHAENIFVAGQTVSGVIDWEDYQAQGIPAFDLCHFIKTYFEALFSFAANQGDLALLGSLASNPDNIKLVEATAANYFKAVGLDPGQIAVLLPLYLIQAANQAGEPRKLAMGSLRRLEILMQLAPNDLADLLLYLSVFNYGELYNKAMLKGDKKISDHCRSKIQAIQETAKRQQT